MKAKLQYIIIDGPQIVLAIIALALLTVWIVAHFCKGTLSFPGLIVAAIIWGIMFSLTRLAIRDYKQDTTHPSNK